LEYGPCCQSIHQKSTPSSSSEWERVLRYAERKERSVQSNVTGWRGEAGQRWFRRDALGDSTRVLEVSIGPGADQSERFQVSPRKRWRGRARVQKEVLVESM
jgi:hypothetical protein